MIIREAIEIDAPLSVVWAIFTCLSDWAEWNGVCRGACLIAPSPPDEKTGEAVSEGACIAFTIRPAIFPIRITPRVTKYVPHREIVWEGSRFGVQAEHAFSFDERGESVVVTSTEKFGGFGLFLSRLALIPPRLHRLTRELLLALKKEAESRVLPGKL